MTTKIYNKLVRDRIPEYLLRIGKKPTWKSIDSRDEIRTLLCGKLREELAEFEEKPSIEEIADLFEVILGLVHNAGVTRSALEQCREAKERERGGFLKGVILETVEE